MINDKIREAKEKKLNKLNLSGQGIAKIPQEIFDLEELESLDISNNRLTNIPEDIDNLSNLTELNLSGNQLTSIPENIGNLTNLIDLNLSENQLLSLPESIDNLANLTKLDLSKNPLINPPIEISVKGIKAIQKYLRQQKEVGVDKIYEAKLLIVGEAGSGKTTLAKKIEDSAYKLQASEASTEGIDIIKKSFLLENGEEFKINIWDFGGQEIYHATHRFFLTKRSLYCLVLDNREEDDNLYYWLNIVELLSDNSPVLIIKNEKQNRIRDINERILKGKFNNIKETLATNLATNKNLDKLFSSIKYFISNLDHIGDKLPATWVKVRQALEQDQRNYIDLNEYLKICEETGINRKEDKLQLSGYLHDIGVCLHFQDDRKSILYKTVILKPEWGTDAVYRVLDNPKVKEKYGCFNDDDLQDIWHEAQYDDMRGELLQLMMKFELCYQIPGSKDTFISPQLLSNNQPEYDWDESNNLILRYTYPDFMPKGIISRFIVVMHQYIDQQKYVWKNGVILQRNNTKAEVIEDFGKREIRIRMVGKDKRDLMTIVSNELDKINNSYKRLKYQKLIPCNCPACKNSQNPYHYGFKKLIERVANNKLTIECGNPPYHEVIVLSLIDDVINLQQLIKKEDEKVNNYNYQNGDLKQFTRLVNNHPIRNVIGNTNNDRETIYIKGIEIKDEAFHLTISDDKKEKKVEKEINITELRSKNEEIIESQLKENYKIEEEEFEEKNKAILKSKDEEIRIYKEQVEELKEIIRNLSKEPIIIKQESERNQ